MQNREASCPGCVVENALIHHDEVVSMGKACRLNRRLRNYAVSLGVTVAGRGRLKEKPRTALVGRSTEKIPYLKIGRAHV